MVTMQEVRGFVEKPKNGEQGATKSSLGRYNGYVPTRWLPLPLFLGAEHNNGTITPSRSMSARRFLFFHVHV